MNQQQAYHWYDTSTLNICTVGKQNNMTVMYDTVTKHIVQYDPQIHIPPFRYVNNIPEWCGNDGSVIMFIDGQKIMQQPKVAQQVYAPQTTCAPQTYQESNNPQIYTPPTSPSCDGGVNYKANSPTQQHETHQESTTYQNETKPKGVGMFPDIEPLKNENVNILDKDIILDKEQITFNTLGKDTKIRNTSHLDIMNLVTSSKKIEGGQIDVYDLIYLYEGYSHKNNVKFINEIISHNSWDDIHHAIESLQEKALRSFLDRVITAVLNDKFRFIGLKYYADYGGYMVNMMESFLNEYHTFNSKMASITSVDSDSYDKDIATRIRRVYTEVRESIIHGLKDVGDLSIKDTPFMNKILTDANSVIIVVPKYLKLILIHDENIGVELDALEIGETRNITTSEKLMRILTLVTDKDRESEIPTDYYQIKIATSNHIFDITKYYKETLITKVDR